MAALHHCNFTKGVTDEKNEEEEKDEREEEDERTGEADEFPTNADTCSPAPHLYQEAAVSHEVTDTALESDTLPQSEDLLATSHLYLLIIIISNHVKLLVLLL